MSKSVKSALPLAIIFLFGGAIVIIVFLLTISIFGVSSRPKEVAVVTSDASEDIKIIGQNTPSRSTSYPIENTENVALSATQYLPESTQKANPAATSSPSPTPAPTLPAPVPNSMSISEKIGQMIMVGVDGTVISTYTCQILQDLKPGAIVYRGENVISPDQLRSFSQEIRSCLEQVSDKPVLIAIDHEGQYVNRFDTGATVFPSAIAMGAANDLDLTYQSALAAGQELAYSGVNMVLGPVADILTNPDNSVISFRSFGSSPEVVATQVSAAVRGYQDAGIIPILKHFPGHGGTLADSHYTLPVDNIGAEIIETDYLLPYVQNANNNLVGIMTAHVAFPVYDNREWPATISKNTLALLKNKLAYDGLILSDSMGMAAVTKSLGFDIPESSIRAVKAGVNMLLISDLELAIQTRDKLVQAVDSNRIPVDIVDEGVRKILALKNNWSNASQEIFINADPDFVANRDLSYQVGYQSVAIFKDDSNLVPIPDDIQQVLIIGPTDYWHLYPALQNAFSENGIYSQIITYAPPISGYSGGHPDVQSVIDQARAYDLTILLTWDAHLARLSGADWWQTETAKQLLGHNSPAVFVALRSPVDLLDFPNSTTYLATFGTTSGQVQGLADILTGKYEPTSINPIQEIVPP